MPHFRLTCVAQKRLFLNLHNARINLFPRSFSLEQVSDDVTQILAGLPLVLAIPSNPNPNPNRLGNMKKGMPISLRFWEWGCPKRRDAHITVTAGREWISRRGFFAQGKAERRKRLHLSHLLSVVPCSSAPVTRVSRSPLCETGSARGGGRPWIVMMKVSSRLLPAWLSPRPESASLFLLNARLRAVSLFSVVHRAKRETRKWPPACLMARDGRGLPPSFRSSRGFAARARVHSPY